MLITFKVNYGVYLYGKTYEVTAVVGAELIEKGVAAVETRSGPMTPPITIPQKKMDASQVKKK